MVERSDGHRLAPEALAGLRVGRHPRRQELDGYLTIEPGIPSAIHLAHAAFAQLVENSVVADGCPNHEQPC